MGTSVPTQLFRGENKYDPAVDQGLTVMEQADKIEEWFVSECSYIGGKRKALDRIKLNLDKEGYHIAYRATVILELELRTKGK